MTIKWIFLNDDFGTYIWPECLVMIRWKGNCHQIRAHTDWFFVVRSSEKKSEWRSDFLSEWVSHTDRLFIADKTSDLPYDLLECHLAHTAWFFIGAIVCVRQWQARSHCWITSLRFFIGLKSAHTNRFSLRFFVYDKKTVHVRSSSLTKASVCTKPWLTLVWLHVF